MFKRQKMLDTQKIMSDMTQSLQTANDDSLNLQITGIVVSACIYLLDCVAMCAKNI